MTRPLGAKLRAERLAAWAGGGATAVCAAFVLPKAWSPTVAACLAALCLVQWAVAHRLLRARAYTRGGCVAATCLRAVQASGATALCVLPALRAESIWWLAVPAVFCEAFVSRRPLRAMAVLAPAGLALAFFALQAGLVSSELAAAEGLYCAATAAGLLLGSIVGREEDLNAHRRRLDEVLECTAGFAAGSDPGSTVLQALKTAVEELGASAGYVMLTGPDGQGDLQTEAAYSPDGEFRFPRTLEIGRGVTGQAVKSRRPVRTRNSGDARLSSEVPGESAKTAVSVPLIVRIRRTGGSSPTECVLGALTLVERDQARPFEAEEVRFLRGLAALVSASVAANQMEQLRQTTFLNTLETLAYSLEARDPYTSGHSQRTSVVSLMIAEALGFDADALEELRVGTILHDIGKIGVPDAVLQKPGKLAPEELAAMRKHAIVGYDICKPLGLSEGVLMIVRNHHERLDGTGYPDGLRGGELPLSLRIVCVADAFDAMSSRRPYRDVMELAKVQAELSRGAGTQFDPLVVEALRELIPTPRLQALYGEQWGNDLGRAA